MVKVKKVKIKKAIILLIIICAAAGLTLICINKYNKYESMKKAERYGGIIYLNIDTVEWKNLKKEIMNKYPKIKKIEIHGGHDSSICYYSNCDIDKKM